MPDDRMPREMWTRERLRAESAGLLAEYDAALAKERDAKERAIAGLLSSNARQLTDDYLKARDARFGVNRDVDRVIVRRRALKERAS